MAFLQRLLRLRPNVHLLNRRYSLRPETIQFSEEVSEARKADRPLVALESTIITHGMPYPQNLETAMQVENVIRERGATPATVAIIAGQLHVGLSPQQLQYLAQAKGVVKASRRDLAAVVAGRLDGATTVAGTIIAAELADIPVFVTGGIGGVHREGQETLDVSADLTELGRSRTLVVCSGVKSILDIGRTLEYLETQGVCVCAFGATHDFPAFYTRWSGHRAPHRVADAAQAARLAHASHNLRLLSGIVVAVPLPEEHAMDESVINTAIEGALADAKSQGVGGKDVTPFILAAVSKATAGASLAANIALIKNNAGVGADIAVELNSLRNDRNMKNASNIGVTWGGPSRSRGIHTSCSAHRAAAGSNGQILRRDPSANGPLLVIGGANIDRTYRVTEENVKLDGSTHACAAASCGGGVARNMAEALWRMRGPGSVRLLSAVGDDADGRYVEDIAKGLLLDGCVVKGGRTANYASVMDAKGECLIGFGDMELHNQITMELVDKHMEVLKRSPFVVLDGNAPQDTVDHVVKTCGRLDKPVFFEPTDKRKATKILLNKSPISFASPNINELRAMADAVKPNHRINITNDSDEIIKLAKIVAQVIGYLLVTVGSRGIIVVRNNETKLYPVEPLKSIVNVSGAGDCFSSGFIHGMLTGVEEARCISLGFRAAAQALATKNTVPEYFVELNLDLKAYSKAL